MRAPYLLAVLIALAGLVALAAPGHAASPPAAQNAASVSPAERKEILQKLDDYFNDIDTLKCDFIQVAPDGSLAQGRIYIKRPGYLRVEYDPPTKFLIVGDGKWINMIDYEVKDVSRWAIADTPLKVLVKDDLDLARDVDIESIEEGNGIIRLTVSAPDVPGQEHVTFLFSEDPLRLAQWQIADGGGQSTRVALSNIETGVKLSSSLFTYDDPRPKRGPRR